jgi:GT2 family glycosyltransferase
LGWRAWLFGYKVLFCPTSIVYHEAGGTAGKGRLSPLKTFHGTKDSIITITKNLELRNLLFGFVVAFLYEMVEIFFLIKGNNLKCVKMKIKAFSWLFKNLGRILEKRQIIQSNRVVSDKWLQHMHFLATLQDAFEEYRRLGEIAPLV